MNEWKNRMNYGRKKLVIAEEQKGEKEKRNERKWNTSNYTGHKSYVHVSIFVAKLSNQNQKSRKIRIKVTLSYPK